VSRAWGVAPWRVDAAIPAAPLPARVEVAVVGAGLAGLSAALDLAEHGVRVAVFEAARVGAGASGRSGGIALEGTADGGPREGVQDCLAFLADTVKRHSIDCDLVLDGCLEVRHVAAERARAPSWPEADGTRIVQAARVTGGALDPGALVAGLAAAAARRATCTLHEGTRVTGIEPGAPLRLLVAARDGEARVVEAGRVLLALDAFLSPLVPAAGARAALTLALATEPLPRATLEAVGLGWAPFYTLDVPYLWGRATREGRLVVGAGLVFEPEGDVERLELAQPEAQAGLARLEQRVRGLHPALADVAVTHRWGGPIAFRAGGVPILAELGPGLLATGAFAGHGVALAVRVGALASAWLRGAGSLPRWGELVAA
jgi:gamma-glutamylputrescine oxidase